MTTSVPAVVRAVREALAAAADPTRATGAAAYMRDQFPFVGVATPQRRRIVRDIMERLGTPDDVVALATTLWALPEREYQYVACDVLSSKPVLTSCSPDDLAPLTALVTTKPWWDTVDYLVPKVLGSILLRHRPLLVPVTTAWIEHDSIWLQRAAIIVQLGWKRHTDADLLFRHILRRADSTEFFVRKGAGWALRAYSKTDSQAVRSFIDDNRDLLPSLTVREGSKYC